MGKVSRFGVAFIGYMARVVGLRNETEIDYAQLDFVSGSVMLMADHALVTVPNLSDLAPFVASLPGHAEQLRKVLRQGKAKTEIKFEKNSVTVDAASNVNRQMRQLSKRCSEVLPVLAQVQDVGKQIRRRPYAEYIQELAETGIARVVFHGFGVFEKNTLSYRPQHHEALVRPVEAKTFSVEPCGPSPDPNAAGNC
jgi:hypothetical protein